MDFRKFLEMVNEEDAYDKDVKPSDKPHDKEAAAERAKKAALAAKDKKKSLKDWFEKVETEKLLSEAEQITMEPAKQSTQVIKQGTKTLGTVSNPALAATIKSAIGKGEMSLAGDQLKEEEPMMEKAPPGMEDVVLSLKKKFPGEEGRAYAIAWSMYNKKHGKNEAAEDNPESAMLEADKWIQKAIKKPGALKKQLGVPADEPIPAGKLAAAAEKGGKLGQRARLAQTLKKMHEGDIASTKDQDTRGAGLGAGRNPDVLESKQVNEAMNTLEAAYHEGKSHGLSKHSYACRYNEGSDEHRRYHEGFKEGIDECYGLMPNRGLVVSEVESGQDVVDNMASYGAEEGALGEMDKTAYMKQQAMKTPGDTFKAFGQTMHDKDVLEMDSFAFESLEKQLNELLTEGEEAVAEGLSVNMSQGLNDGMGDDSVSVSATGDDASKLLAFIKQVGLGGLGADKPLDSPAEPAIAISSDYGAPKFGGYDDKAGMMDLMKVMSGGEDNKDEEGHDHSNEETCNECGGMMEAGHKCGEGKEMVDEVQSEDQMEYQVAEDDGEGYEQSQEAGAQIDSALAASGTSKGGATNEDGMESNPLANGAVAAADADEEQEAAMKESSFLNLYKKLALLSEESTAEKDDKAEKAAKKVAKDIEYDEGHKGKDDDKAEKAGKEVKKDIEYDDKKDKKLDEWANDAGKDGTQQTFERDIEFMTKVISGGLNKPKSTGQQTIPVLAGDKDRTGDEDVAEWKRLAGLGQ
jgi:hypothetical protein